MLKMSFLRLMKYLNLLVRKHERLFFIESPFQFLCMVSDFELNDLIVIRATSVNTSLQLASLLDRSKLDKSNVVFFPYLGRIFSGCSILASLIIIAFNRSDVRFGYLPSRVCKTFLYFFREAKSIVYDDGVATMHYQITEVLTKYPNLKIKTLFFQMFSNEQRIVKNKLDPCGMLPFKNEGGIQLKGESIFIGTKVVDDGIVDRAQYLSAVKDAIFVRGAKYYICHRDESVGMLDSITKLGITVVRFDVPVEVAIATGNDKPKAIYGLVTTSLLTSKIIFDLPVFYYPVNVLDEKFHKEINELEGTFDKYNLTRL